jgi:hypothetical protein
MLSISCQAFLVQSEKMAAAGISPAACANSFRASHGHEKESQLHSKLHNQKKKAARDLRGAAAPKSPLALGK